MSIGLPDQASRIETPITPGNAAILVVDEDPAFQLGLKTFLREYVGFEEVFAADSGRKALELLEKEPSIEVVTLDYQMPGMNGIEVLREISEKVSRPLSVMMITGYPSEELESEFKGFASPTLLTSHFLSKPVAFEKLEPLMFRACEELEAAKNAPAKIDEDTELDELPLEDTPVSESESLLHLESQLAAQGIKLDEIQEDVKNIRKGSRSDFWKLVFIGGLIWAAIQFSWLDKLKPTWETVRSEVVTLVESVANRTTNPEKDSQEEATPPPAEAVKEPPPAVKEPAPTPPEDSKPPEPGQPL